jgi:hypothetical protein
MAIVSRVAGRALARHRSFRAAQAGVAAATRVVGRAFRQLGLEVTGFFFLVFAGIGGLAAYREYPNIEAGEGSLGRIAVISVFTLVFLWFGLSSLWRARRKT